LLSECALYFYDLPAKSLDQLSSARLLGANKLKSLSGHYVRLLERKDETWVNTDKIGFVY
jgi:hypothetical protein